VRVRACVCACITSGNKTTFILSVSKFTVFFFWGEKADMATGEGVKRK